MAEAHRVLRKDGRLVLSIPTRFYDPISRRVTEGLLLSPEADDVSAELPWEEVGHLRRLLGASQFEAIEVRSGAVELYVWGKRV